MFRLFSRHNRPLTSRTTGIVFASLLSGSLMLGLTGCGKASPKAAKSPGASSTPPASAAPAGGANFTLAGVDALDAQNRPQAAQAGNTAAGKVQSLLDAYYSAAFLDPSAWSGGTFPTLGNLFTSDAAASVAANLANISLGPEAEQLSSVKATTESAGTVTVLIEPDLSASYATVEAQFNGTGTPKSGNPKVSIAQTAQFMIDVAAGKIAGYDISTTIQGVAGSASYQGTTPIQAAAARLP